MKRNIFRITALTVALAAVLSFAACGSKPVESTKQPDSNPPKTEDVTKSEPPAEPIAEPIELYVSAAASLTDAAKELAAMYHGTHPDVKITYNFGASGKLQTQIEEGAPADVFISASPKQMDALAEKSMLAADTRKDLLRNELVLIGPKVETSYVTEIKQLADEGVKIVGLGDPESVPAGQYAEEVLAYYNILDVVKAKANYGTDVRQVLDWVATGEVDAGMVYSSDAVVEPNVLVQEVAPADSHKPIIYPAAVLEASAHKAEAKAFEDFLFTPEASEVFVKYGFAPISE